MTASLWQRGMLQDEYGVAPKDIHWRTGGQEQPGRGERTPLKTIPGVDIQPIGPNQTLSGMLESGEIDAVFSARAPSCFDRKAPHVRRLFEDSRAVEQDYYRKTGLFPIMHLIGIHKSLAENPGSRLRFTVFCEAKALAKKEVYDVSALYVTVPWLAAEAKQRLIGRRLSRYGVHENAKEIDTNRGH